MLTSGRGCRAKCNRCSEERKDVERVLCSDRGARLRGNCNSVDLTLWIGTGGRSPPTAVMNPYGGGQWVGRIGQPVGFVRGVSKLRAASWRGLAGPAAPSCA